MIYACSDIHGDLAMYNHIISHITNEDTLYIIGDVIDRKPDGIAILQDIMKRENIVLLLGNHEWFLLQCLYLYKDYYMSTWISERNGGSSTAKAFLALSESEQKDIIDYLVSCKCCELLTVNNIKYALVHGCYYKGIENVKSFEDSRLVEDCLWDSELKHSCDDFLDCTIIVHGHVPLGHVGLSSPYMRGKRFIDGGNVFGGCQILYNLNKDTCIYFKEINGKIDSKEVTS